MRQEPWYLPCTLAMGARCHEFATCVNVSICWLCTGMDEARALVLVLCSSSVSPMSSPLLHVSILKNDMFLISLHLLCAAMDEARALVRALCNNNVSPMPWPLLHAWLLINVVFCSWFHYTYCAGAWTRHAPWCMPCAPAVCLLCCRLYCMRQWWKMIIFWFHYTCCARAWTRHAPWYVPCGIAVCVSYVVAFAACMIAHKCSVLLLISLHLLCMSTDETCALVRALRNSSVSRLLLLCNMFQCFDFLVGWGHARGM